MYLRILLQVVGTLFEKYYWTLNGSMQTTLLRLTDTAKDIGEQTMCIFIRYWMQSVMYVDGDCAMNYC